MTRHDDSRTRLRLGVARCAVRPRGFNPAKTVLYNLPKHIFPLPMETGNYASVTNTQRIGGTDADKKVKQIVLTHPAVKAKSAN